jgi:hypothetical protein
MTHCCRPSGIAVTSMPFPGRCAEIGDELGSAVVTRPYYDRPFQVPGAGRFAAALSAAIADPLTRRRSLPDRDMSFPGVADTQA